MFFDKVCTTRDPVHTVPKEKFCIILPYLGSVSGKVKRNLEMLAKRYFPICDLQVVFKSSSRLSSVFSFKDKLPLYLVSGVVYKYTCGRCKSTYVGKTKRHTRKRFAEHAGHSPLTFKFVKGQNSTTIRDHMLICNTVVGPENFSIIGRDRNNNHLKIKESIFIQREKPTLNIRGNSIPLALF